MIIKKLKPCPHDEGAYKAVDLKNFPKFQSYFTECLDDRGGSFFVVFACKI